ncbi:MAG: hypothetical protein ABSB23_19180 [Bryobacteraceae bacterium]|jgi:hypothetical protein
MLPAEARRMRPELAWFTPMAALALLLQPSRASAARLVFSGSLERAGHESISVRLADRRVIDALLPNTGPLAAVTIAAEYKMGDQVRITCKPIPPVWEEDTSRFQSLELTKLELLSRPSPEELSKMPEFPSWSGEVNLLGRPNAAVSAPGWRLTDAPPIMAGGSDSTARRKLEHAREVNLQYAANLPDYVADETAKRYTGHGRPPEWRHLDTIETEIAVSGSRALRRHIRRNGSPWEQPFQALPGFKWYGGFGTEIRPLFNTQCPTTIEYQGRAEMRGKQLLEYRFSSPPDGCFAPFYVDYQRYNPARTGHVFIDDSGGNVIQLGEEASGFPAAFEIAQRKEEVSWDYVRIGGTDHLLPVAATFVVLFSSGTWWRVEVQYTNHRHFEASTNITFH